LAEPQGNPFASGFEAKKKHHSYTATELSLLRHREKVAAHAERKLPNSKSEAITAKELRAFVRLEDERLRVADRLGAGGIWIGCARSFALDLVVRRAFEAAAMVAGASSANSNSAVTVVALGGYGRAELAPFSDLDLLFLTVERPLPEIATIVDGCQHLLWDAGLSLSQKSCDVGQAIAISRTDPHFQTALVDARLITGEGTLYDQLVVALDREREKNARLLIDTVRHERDLRYQKRGAAIYLQEPNVKEGAGGLRDLHSALWAAYAQSGLNTLEKLLAHGRIQDDAYQRVVSSYDFLLRVRAEMHWTTGRKTDHLALDLQEMVARKLGYGPSGQWQASERFMRDYYRHAREVHQFSESLFDQSLVRMERTRRWFAPVRRKRLDGLFSLQDGQLHFDGELTEFSQSPALLFRAATLAQANTAVFSHDLGRAIRLNLASIDNEFRASKEAALQFLTLLRRPAEVGHTLRMMHEVGLLGRYLPEFERVSMLIQHDLYHQFTVDEHTLRTIEALDELQRRSDRSIAMFRAVLDQVEDVGLLYLALL
jgi:[protein-PII] uridylyltransferase